MTKGKPMEKSIRGKRISLSPLPDYEARLLATLSFLLMRKPATQASNCLTMYLRQIEPRIVSQAAYYAMNAGVDADVLMDAIYSGKGYELLGENWWNSEPDESRDLDETEELD